MKRMFPLFFVAVIVGIGLAIKYLPWWTILLGGLTLIITGKFLIKRLFFKLLLKPFQLKGAVLKGAKVEVHSVSALPPSRETPEGSDAAPRLGYALDVTITPCSAKTPFGLWEPGELRLVLPDSKLNLSPDAPSDSEDTCEIQKIEVYDEGDFKPDEGMKYPGHQRLRLVIGLKPATSRLKFRYYFEDFGSVPIPSLPLAQAA